MLSGPGSALSQAGCQPQTTESHRLHCDCANHSALMWANVGQKKPGCMLPCGRVSNQHKSLYDTLTLILQTHTHASTTYSLCPHMRGRAGTCAPNQNTNQQCMLMQPCLAQRLKTCREQLAIPVMCAASSCGTIPQVCTCVISCKNPQ